LSLTDAVICAGLGAFAYHLYAKVSNLENDRLEMPLQAITIGAQLDKPDGDGDNEEGRFRFGFHNNRR
jgi:hypothetical protein